MRKKIYAKYNKRSEQIEFIFIQNNDKEAMYNYSIADFEAQEKNRYYNPDDYQLKCLGVIEMNGDNSGICYEFKEDYPFTFDEIKDGYVPKHNEPITPDDTVIDNSEKEAIIRESKI